MDFLLSKSLTSIPKKIKEITHYRSKSNPRNHIKRVMYSNVDSAVSNQSRKNNKKEWNSLMIAKQ